MSDITGYQVIGCNVSSCQHFKNNYCELYTIQVGYSTNVTSGIPEDETLCMNYKRR